MAAKISQGLPAISFAKNLPNIILSDATDIVHLSIIISGEPILSDIVLTPDANNRITIFTREFVLNIPHLAKPATTLTPIAQIGITLEIGPQLLLQTCKILPGEVDITAPNMAEFLARNFLTWQPQIIETTAEQPQYIGIIKSDRYIITEIHSTLTTTNGATYTKMLESIASPLVYAQFDVCFEALWGNFCSEKGLTPVSYDVFGKSYLPSNPEPELQPAAQRYIIQSAHYNDTCFAFINTLGGLDTLMMQGRVILKPEGEIDTFTNNRQEVELLNNYTSYWEASTGRIDSQRMSAQFQDLIKSPDRWIYKDRAWQKIIIDEYKIEDTPFELNTYTIKYHLAIKNESRYYERTELPEVELPTIF